MRPQGRVDSERVKVRPGPSIAKRLRCERGAFSLAELMIASATMMVVFIAIMGLAHVAGRQATGTEDKVYSMLDQRTGLERILREMRDGTNFDNSSFNNTKTVVFNTPNRGQVKIDCDSTKCTVTKGGTTEVLVRNVVNKELGAPVFCIRKGSHLGVQYTEVRLLVRPPPFPGSNAQRNPIPLTGGVNLRNFATDAEPDESCS